MNEVHYAEQVDVDRVDERLRRQAGGHRADTGIGDHDVEVTELGHAAIDRRRQGRAVADVGDLGVSALAFLLHQPGCLVEILRPCERILVGLDVLADVHGDDVGALGGQQSCMRPPLTSRGSADQRHLARHPAHGVLSRDGIRGTRTTRQHSRFGRRDIAANCNWCGGYTT